MKTFIVSVLLGTLFPAGVLAQQAPTSSSPTVPALVYYDQWLRPFPTESADTFIRKGIQSGSSISRDECESASSRENGRFVFVEAMGRTACIRYYLSTETIPKKSAAVVIEGDKGAFRVLWRNGQYEVTPEELASPRPQGAKEPVVDMDRRISDPERLQKMAVDYSVALRAPVILLARPGSDGSSGWIALRRTRWEAEIASRALDVVKVRHGVETIHVAGLFGGGQVAAAFAAQRSDIVCAVLGAATLSYDPRSFYLSDRLPLAQRFFNPVEHTTIIAQKPGLRLMLVTDERLRINTESQGVFLNELAKLGVKAPQFLVSANASLGSNVLNNSIAALRACIAGVADDSIAGEISHTLREKRSLEQAAEAKRLAEEAEEKRNAELEGQRKAEADAVKSKVMAQASQPRRGTPPNEVNSLSPFPSERADTFVREGMQTGSFVTPSECQGAMGATDSRFVYVEAMGRGACIRYYLSGVAAGKAAAFFLDDDKGEFSVSWRNGSYEVTPLETLSRPGQPSVDMTAVDLTRRISDPQRLQIFARELSGRLLVPTIVLARQGSDGSSGWVALRRTRWEVEITNRAVDAIKMRHGVEKLHFAGRGGGGHLVGAMATLRSDIVCAVAASAPLFFHPQIFALSNHLPEPLRYFNPAEHAAVIAKRQGLRLMVVTDEREDKTAVERQASFLRAVALHKNKLPQYFVSNSEPAGSGSITYALSALQACIGGKTDQEIGVTLANESKVRRDAEQAREAERKRVAEVAEKKRAADEAVEKKRLAELERQRLAALNSGKPQTPPQTTVQWKPQSPAPSQPVAGANPTIDKWIMPFPKAPADTFTREGVRTGSLVTQAECDAARARDRINTVYVEAMGRGVCMRYYLSTAGFSGKVAAVWMDGDKGRFSVFFQNGQYSLVPEEFLNLANQPAKGAADLSQKIGTPERYQALARDLSNRLSVPTIVIARQGVDGSSGWVALRRTRWEVAVTNLALDLIKERHGVQKLHLVGQSGGGHLVGSLASLRSDIGCAVSGAGVLAFPGIPYLSDKIPESQRHFHPVDHVAAIAKKPGLRLMVVTDGRDVRAWVDGQAQFVRALAGQGRKVPHYFVSASDALNHSVGQYSFAALGSCIAGKSDDRIALELSRMNTQALERRLNAGR
jgi:pimeloyl-ACP methyl ester carboxylesterase